MSEMNNTPAPEQPAAEAPSHEETMARQYFEASPSELPPQFGGDVDKFMDSWKEQRAALTRAQQEVAELRGAQAPPVEEAAPAVEAPEAEAPMPDALNIPEAPEAPTADAIWATAGQELVQGGDVSAETRAELLTRGIPAEVVDSFVAGQQAKSAQAARQAADVVGGPETLQSIIDWATNNLNDGERDTVNAALQGPGWQTTVLGLKARMESANPTAREAGPGPALTSEASTAPAIVPYANPGEMSSAIADPRYGIEPQYTNFVQERIRRTTIG